MESAQAAGQAPAVAGRKGHFGELVQLDGSFHPWFGDERYPCLRNMVDDTTGTTWAYFSGEETTEAAMRLLWGWIKRYGVPRALYTDRKSVYVTSREATREEELAGREPMTAFGLACHRLGIEIITATSPQAKGRMGRSHGVYQDRLVKELGLRRVTSLEGASQLLREGFIDGVNRRFAKPAASACDFHRPVPSRSRAGGHLRYRGDEAGQQRLGGQMGRSLVPAPARRERGLRGGGHAAAFEATVLAGAAGEGQRLASYGSPVAAAVVGWDFAIIFSRAPMRGRTRIDETDVDSATRCRHAGRSVPGAGEPVTVHIQQKAA